MQMSYVFILRREKQLLYSRLSHFLTIKHNVFRQCLLLVVMAYAVWWGEPAAWCLCNSPAFSSSIQIKEKLLQLTEKRKEMIDKWEDRWEWLRLSKDVLGFLLGRAIANSLFTVFLSVEKTCNSLLFY